jgi:hypothetical protein
MLFIAQFTIGIVIGVAIAKIMPFFEACSMAHCKNCNLSGRAHTHYLNGRAGTRSTRPMKDALAAA